MSRERLGNVLSETDEERRESGHPTAMRGVVTPASSSPEAPVDPDAEAEAFIRFCYRRRAVAWPELYDEMCAVAARGEFRGMSYEQLESHGIRLALQALPRLAAMAASVIAEERRIGRAVATA